MKNNTKAIIIIVAILAISGIVYLSSRQQSNINNDGSGESVNQEDIALSASTTIPSTQIKEVVKNKSPETKTLSPQGTTKYKGEFFPFELSYPSSFIIAKNIAPSTKEYETRTYSFARLALNGGISGYFSFYVNPGDDTKYRELVKTYPDKYSIVVLNGYTFYKRVEKNESSSNEYKIEYVTFKNDVQYRLSLIVSNGDRKSLDVKTYQNELNVAEEIAKSLKIN